MAYRHYIGRIDIDANQRDPCPYKDMSDITYYNYSRKGYFNREYYSPKKDRQRPTLGKQVATIEQGTKVVEVSAYNAYNQDDLKDTVNYKSQYVREDLEEDIYKDPEQQVYDTTDSSTQANITKAVLRQNLIRTPIARTYTKALVN